MLTVQQASVSTNVSQNLVLGATLTPTTLDSFNTICTHFWYKALAESYNKSHQQLVAQQHTN